MFWQTHRTNADTAAWDSAIKNDSVVPTLYDVFADTNIQRVSNSANKFASFFDKL